MNIENIFILFLKKYRKYQSYKRQTDFIKGGIYPSINLISEAFLWSGSEEGWEFWDEMNYKWEKLLIHFKIDSSEEIIITNKLVD